ncbi:MAG: hypothetical protein AAGD38_19355 [Acidobacteriota bacterium]
MLIEVDTTGAVWPVVVETLSDDAKLLASDGAEDDGFGRVVAISGDTIVVGSGEDDDNGDNTGSAYVFEKPPGGWTGSLTETAKLLTSQPATRFGEITLDISGDTIVVGAWATAYVFEKPPGGWTGILTEDAILTASDAPTEDSFGRYSLAIDGDTIVVGRREAFDNGVNSGKAYVFEKPPGGWTGNLTEDAVLIPSDGAMGDTFGSVAIDGDTIVVGASLADPQGENSGAAYVFERPPGGWVGTILETAKLLPTTGAANDRFGFAPVIRDQEVVIGAFDAEGAGAAYVFREPVGGWIGTVTESAKLLPSDGVAGDQFGQSVAFSGERIVIGAPQDDDLGINSGAAFLFTRPIGGWTGTLNETEKLRPTDNAAFDFFAERIGIESGVVVIGAQNDDDNGDNSGSAYVFAVGVIFSDGFESGDFGAWSSVVP